MTVGTDGPRAAGGALYPARRGTARKGIGVTPPAGAPMSDMETVVSALATHATWAAEKLRQHGLVAGTMTVFYHTSRFSAGKAPLSVRREP